MRIPFHSRGVAPATAAALAAVAAGCGAGTAPRQAAASTVARQPCAAVARLARLPRHGVLRGDVDGDGRPDRVSVVYDRHGRAGCRYFVLVEARRATVAAAIRGTAVPTTGPPAPGAPPTVEKLAAIGPRPSVQILVRVQQGASVSGGVVFDYRRGALRPLPIVGWRRGTVFEYNGGATFLDGVDCLGGRRSSRVVQITGGETDSTGVHWSVRKDVFALRSRGFVHVSAAVTPFAGTEAQLVRRIPAASGRAFASCGLAG